MRKKNFIEIQRSQTRNILPFEKKRKKNISYCFYSNFSAKTLKVLMVSYLILSIDFSKFTSLLIPRIAINEKAVAIQIP